VATHKKPAKIRCRVGDRFESARMLRDAGTYGSPAGRIADALVIGE
jgi:hypothetical protein